MKLGSGPMWTAAEATHESTWESFLSRAGAVHHTQTATWARAKGINGWSASQVIVKHEGEPVAGAQVLLRSVGWLGFIGFVPAGPVFTARRPAESEFQMIEALRRLAAIRRIRLLVVQPPSGDRRLLEQLDRSDFTRTGIRVSPRSTVVIDLEPDEEALFAKMRKKHRQGVRRARREGLTVRQATEASIDADIRHFAGLLDQSGRRVGYRPFSEAYHSQLWHSFNRSPDPTSRCALLFVEHDGTPVTALLMIGYGTSAATKSIGWSGSFPNLKPNQLAYWAGVQWAKESGYDTLDLEGIADEAADLVLAGKPLTAAVRSGPSFLKLGMGGTVQRSPEAYAYAGHRLLRLGVSRVLPTIESSPAMGRLLDRVRTASSAGLNR